MPQSAKNKTLLLILLLLPLICSTSFAGGPSKRRILTEQVLSTTPMPSVAVGTVAPSTTAVASTTTVATANYGLARAGVTYISSDPGVPSSAPLAYPPAPPADANLPMLQQMVQAFMNWKNQVEENGDWKDYDDMEDPKDVARRSTAPALDDNIPAELDPGCDGLSKEALQKMRGYLQRCRGSLEMSSSGKIAITDFSTNRPVLYLLNPRDLSCAGSTRVTYGVGSHANLPKASNVDGSHATPAGFMITKPHHGEAYKEPVSIGIQGMGSENSLTVNRGVIFHPASHHTWGCIGIPDKRFITVKQALAYGSVIYNYFPQQTSGTSEMRCPVYRENVRAGRYLAGSQPAPAGDAPIGEDGFQ